MRPSALVIVASTLVTSAHAFNYTIGVGKDETTGNLAQAGFDPSRTTIQSPSPNLLVFDFFGGTHRVAQTGFAEPCTASNVFDTGLQTVPDGTSEGGPQFVYTIPDGSTGPIYFADIASNNCQSGAVFCVNTDEASTVSCAAFKAKALALGGGSNSSSTATGSRVPLDTPIATRPLTVNSTTPAVASPTSATTAANITTTTTAAPVTATPTLTASAVSRTTTASAAPAATTTSRAASKASIQGVTSSWLFASAFSVALVVLSSAMM